MLKNIIYKYFLKEIFKTFTLVLFAFTAIAWTVRAVNFLDLIVENAIPFNIYLFYSVLHFFGILTKFIPLAMLIALIVSILKFQQKKELTILWSSGVEKISLVKLFVFISILVLFIQMSFASLVSPYVLNKSRSLIANSNYKNFSSVFKANEFIDVFKKTTFFIEEINSSDDLKNIFIRGEDDILKSMSSNDESNLNTTIVAKKGRFINDNLILQNGSIQTLKKNGEIDVLNFNTTEINFGYLTNRVTSVPKIQETPTLFILKCKKFEEINRDTKEFSCHNEKIKSETISRRLGMPLYIPLLSLVSSFLLLTSKRNNNVFKKYFYYVFGFIILITSEIFVRYTGVSNVYMFIYFLIPFFLFPIFYYLLSRKFRTEMISI